MNGKTLGCVALVGAGPGNPGLLTLRGKALLDQAQAVVYDRLVSPEILAMIPCGAKKINVGKDAGNHPVPQHEINQILLREARAGLRVVRLKGGDPYIFGRGGEELELLLAAQIPFEVVPGITSAIAAPSFGGIPLTHRDFCSSLHIVTGHQKENLPLKIEFEALVRTGGTLVFLMGVSALPQIVRGLLQAGMPGDMPAALVENGTRPEQRKVLGTLSTIEDAARDAAIVSPAVIVVGRVCSLGNAYNWFERLPLKGKTILVTRPADSLGTLSGSLRDLGAHVVDCPCITTEFLPFTVEDLSPWRWLVFTSKHGVTAFFSGLQKQNLDARALANHKIAVTGPQTAAALGAYGIRADYTPEVYDGVHLGKGLGKLCAPGEGLLILRAQDGSPGLLEALDEAGRTYCDKPLYKTGFVGDHQEKIRALLENSDGPVPVSFTSASTVEGFVRQVPAPLLQKVKGVCIGAQTAAAARRYNIPHLVSSEATTTSMVETFLAL